MPPCSFPLTFLAMSINRIPEVDRQRSERWWGISTRSRCRGITHAAATHDPTQQGNENLCHFYS
jgi:hypothetical protein